MKREKAKKSSYKKTIFFLLSIMIFLTLLITNENKLEASGAYYENWNLVNEANRTLQTGNYFVKDDVIIEGQQGESGLLISGNVNLYIAEGKTLKVRGGAGIATNKASGAGIELGKGASLSVFGKGCIEAVGGDGHVQVASNVIEETTVETSISYGAGAGIGGKGGLEEYSKTDQTLMQTNVISAQTMGYLYVYDQVTILATSGKTEGTLLPSASIGSGGGKDSEGESSGEYYVAKSANVSSPTSSNALHKIAQRKEMREVSLDLQEGIGENVSYAVVGMPLASMDGIPTKEGHTFEGYYSLPNGKGVPYINKLGIATQTTWEESTTVLYANWTLNHYTLKLLYDGVDDVIVTGATLQGDNTYSMKYGDNVTLQVKEQKDTTFLGWYGEDGILSSSDLHYSFTVPSNDRTLKVIAKNDAMETPSVPESKPEVSKETSTLNLHVTSEGKLIDLGLVTLENASGQKLTMHGSGGTYTITQTLDPTQSEFKILVAGKDTGKTVKFDRKEGYVINLNYHRLNIKTSLNDQPQNFGVVELYDRSDHTNKIQLFYDETLGYATGMVLEDHATIYQIKVANQWMREEIKLEKANDIVLDFYQTNIQTSLDGVNKSMGDITLRNDQGESVVAMSWEGGRYQAITREKGSFHIYVDGIDSNLMVQTPGQEELEYYTVSYEISNPEVEGSVPQSSVVLKGTTIEISNDTSVSRKQHRFLGWRYNRQLYAPGTQIEIQRTTQFYDTWESEMLPQQQSLVYWVDELGFETLDEAVLATQMTNSSAFGKTRIRYENQQETTKELYGALPNGYILYADTMTQLRLSKGKSFVLGDRNSKDTQLASMENIQIIVDGGQLQMDGQHAKWKNGHVILMPENRIHLFSDLHPNSELLVECWEEENKPALESESNAWKQDSVIVTSDTQRTTYIDANTRIINEGYAIYKDTQKEQGGNTLRLMAESDVVAMRQFQMEDKEYTYDYKSIQAAIDESASVTIEAQEQANQIYVLKDSSENLVLYGDDPSRLLDGTVDAKTKTYEHHITLLSGTRNVNKKNKQIQVQTSNTSRTLTGTMRVGDVMVEQEVIGTIYRLDNMKIEQPIHIEKQSKIEVLNSKIWDEGEVITLQPTSIDERQVRQIMFGEVADSSHFKLSNALLTQGYAFTYDQNEITMKYYGKPLQITEDLKSVNTSENETYTMQFKFTYEDGISDNEAMNDVQYQEVQYEWQRRPQNETTWESLPKEKSNMQYQEGEGTISYYDIASLSDKNYRYRCLVWNKVGEQAKIYPSTKEANVVVSEEPSSFVVIPKTIQLKQEHRSTRGNQEYEELSSSHEISLVSYKDTPEAKAMYQVYTKPTFTLQLDQGNLANNAEYTIQVLKAGYLPMGNDELLMNLQQGGKEKEPFYLYGSNEQGNILGIYKGNMTFRVERIQAK